MLNVVRKDESRFILGSSEAGSSGDFSGFGGLESIGQYGLSGGGAIFPSAFAVLLVGYSLIDAILFG